MQKIYLAIGDYRTNGDDVVPVTPDDILATLQARRKDTSIQIVHCSVEQFLLFLEEMQQDAISKHVASSIN